MMYQNILFEKQDGIGLVTLNRPANMNALNHQTWEEIGDVVRRIRKDDNVRVVVITGAGEKAFAGGTDISFLKERSLLETLYSDTSNILMEITNLSKPVIAAIDGYALGGGCELAMACDIRIATEKSQFGQPEVNLGITPGSGATQRLQRLVGMGKAKELIFTGDIINATEAQKIGLVNKIVADRTALFEEVEAMARKMMKKGMVAIGIAKAAINIGSDVDLRSGLLFEKACQAVTFATEDKEEGMNAFLEKRKPLFKGK